jgi:hypothetical protein
MRVSKYLIIQQLDNMKTLYLIFSILVAMVGYHIHGSLFWSVMDFIFTPITIIKWLICHEVTMTIIKDTFSWFFM